ncbi:hypothetical protein CR513_20158, partial [Mucuna pruriens]
MHRENKRLDCKARVLLHQCVSANETIADYFNRIQVVTKSMRACGEAMVDSKIMEKVLRTLTLNFDHIIVAIESQKILRR